MFLGVSIECIITGRNEVVAKVIFLHLFVIHSVHRGRLPQCMLGYPPGADTPSPKQTSPWSRPPGARPPWSRHPPGADTPGTRHPPRANTPQDQTPPEQTLPPGSRLQHTVYERPVRILLECILVTKRDDLCCVFPRTVHRQIVCRVNYVQNV